VGLVVFRIERRPRALASPRRHAADIGDLDEKGAPRAQRPQDAVECVTWIGEVLDDVPRADRVEALGGQVDIFDEARRDLDPEPLCGAARDRCDRLDSAHTESGAAGLVEEVTGSGSELEQVSTGEIPLHEPYPQLRLEAALAVVALVVLPARIVAEVLGVVEAPQVL
jgi:hypothetical protein